VHNVTKRFIIGPGGSLSSGLTVPPELGMHTLVFQIRDSTGSRVVKSAYFKIGVVNGFEDLQGNVTSNRTLVNTKAYRLRGTVFVKNSAVLTIEPGTFIIGQPGSQPASSLFITQTGKIIADGTRSRPIIFTSSLPFGQRKPGDWGGLVLLGKAPVNWPTGFGNIEGLTASDDTLYGGSDPNHDCGTLRYARVEYAGAEFQPNNEINAITFGGCGKGTVVDHVQTRYGLDDMFEWFGGTMDAKYLVGSYARDDFIDVQIGYTGRIQYVVGVAGKGRSVIAASSMTTMRHFGASPITKSQVYNVTMVGAGDTLTQGFDEGTGVAGAWLRRGTGGTFNNIILFNWISNGFTIRDDATVAAASRGDLTVNGLLMWDNGKASGNANTLEGQTSGSSNLGLPFLQGSLGEAKSILIANPKLRRPLELSDCDFRPSQDSPIFRANWIQPPDDGFFDQSPTWIGAFGDIDWTEEWTCFHVEADVAPKQSGSTTCGGLDAPLKGLATCSPFGASSALEPTNFARHNRPSKRVNSDQESGVTRLPRILALLTLFRCPAPPPVKSKMGTVTGFVLDARDGNGYGKHGWKLKLSPTFRRSQIWTANTP
jgi:hypothetical protein